MNNSYVEVLSGLYSAIFADCRVKYPKDHKGLEREESRLLSLLKTRGLGFVTLDLPSAGKGFDLSLSTGFLTDFDGIPGFSAKGSKVGSCVPKFLSTLMLKVFSDSGVLLDDPDITSIQLLRQIFYSAKKLKVDCDEQRTADAVREFFRIEESLRSPSLDWLGDSLGDNDGKRLSLDDHIASRYSQGQDSSAIEAQSDLFLERGEGGSEGIINCEPFGNPNETLWLSTPQEFRRCLEVVQHCADIISSSLGWFDPFEWGQKHGPGAVSDLKSGVSKYSFPNWPDKLEVIFPQADFAFANYGIWGESIRETDHGFPGLSQHEPPAKLIAVPKTQKAPRLIASEPTAHQFSQQSLNAFLRSRIDRTPIRASVDFTSQEPNKDLALKASATRSHATIDLSSASDRMSLWVVERFFRSNRRLLEALHSCRTRWLVNNIDRTPSRAIILKKAAAQGAAFTFPLQTIIYSTVAVGCMLYALNLHPSRQNIRRMARQVRVFGDDIIVPIGAYGVVANVLTTLGFEVNTSKSFADGFFRESCGCDAYKGVDVTPVYFRRSYDQAQPTSITSTVSVACNFYKKGLVMTSDWIKSTLPSSLLAQIPLVPFDSGAFGFLNAEGLDYGHLETRFNKNIQQLEARTLVVDTRQRRDGTHWSSHLLQYFVEAPSPDLMVKWKSGVDGRVKTRVRFNQWVPVERLSERQPPAEGWVLD